MTVCRVDPSWIPQPDGSIITTGNHVVSVGSEAYDVNWTIGVTSQLSYWCRGTLMAVVWERHVLMNLSYGTTP